MSTKNVETIIIGAGISGLSCANQLNANNKDFLIISKDIGGRILTSEGGNSNYGAFFVCSDYHHVLKYSKLKSRIRLRDFCFHDYNEKYVLYQPKLIPYINQFLKIKKNLHIFRKKLQDLRKTSEFISQKQAIEKDPYLHHIYMQNATDYVKKNKLQSGTDTYFSKALYSTTFSKIEEMNAFSFLQFLLPLITKIYTFQFQMDKLTQPFKENIQIGEVTNLEYKNKLYKIKFNDNFAYAKNIVLATQIEWSKKFSNVKKVNKPIETNMLHIKGAPKKNISKGKYQLFNPDNTVQAIADLTDGTYLLYYKKGQIDLNKYFDNHQIIAHKFWDPAGTINGHNLIEANRGNNMYLIGDYNIAGLEEAYITGIYCARQIISNNEKDN